MNQNDAILNFLKSGRSLTPLDALEHLGTFRLASRISELRKAGHQIEKQIVRGDNGKHFAKYSLRVG